MISLIFGIIFAIIAKKLLNIAENNCLFRYKNGIITMYIVMLICEVKKVDVRPEDILKMKKKHPCGADSFLVLRSGMDFKLRCTGCGREFMIARSKIEKNIKSIIREKEEP